MTEEKRGASKEKRGSQETGDRCGPQCLSLQGKGLNLAGLGVAPHALFPPTPTGPFQGPTLKPPTCIQVPGPSRKRPQLALGTDGLSPGPICQATPEPSVSTERSKTLFTLPLVSAR